MSFTATLSEPVPVSAAPGLPLLEIKDAGLRYRLLTDRDLTLKGRLMNALSSRPAAPDFWALRNVSFRANRGGIVGIVGRNGSGKSTLLRVIARILEPTEGKVTCRGQVQPLLDLTSTLNGNLTGRENAFVYGALNRMGRDRVRELLPKVIEFAELGPFFDVPVKTYSSGMLARLAFALATQARPDVLLIDELLSVGDEHFQKKSYFRMMKLISQGSLVLIVSHNLAFIEQVCSRAIALSSGRIVADGTPSEVIARYRASLAAV